MGFTQPSFNIKNNIRLGRSDNALVYLLAINAFMFAIINVMRIGYNLADLGINDFELTLRDNFLLVGEPEAILFRPWTLFSFMVSHSLVWPFVANMLWLWSFGFLVQNMLGNRHVVPLFLYGGFISGLAFLCIVAFEKILEIPVSETKVMAGASGAILALAVGITSVVPRFKVFPMFNGGIPLWIITGIFLIITLAFNSPGGLPVIIGNVCGALTGFFYAYLLRNGKDAGAWMHRFSNWLLNLFNPEKNIPARSETIAPVRPIYQRKDAVTETRKGYAKTPHNPQQKIDELLDKIYLNGLGSLTTEEKEYLERASKEN